MTKKRVDGHFFSFFRPKILVPFMRFQLGALPIDAEIHRRQLSFVHSILACDNSTIQGLTDRQLIMNLDNPHSFFCKVAGTLTLYELPTIGQLKQHLPSKLTWKLTVKKAIQLYWTEFLLKDMQDKSTLHFMDQTTLKIGSTHPIWTSLSSTVSSVKKGNIKAWLLTGTYLLEINKHKFSSGKESPLCKCCGTENEDVTHFLLLCPALYKQRKESFPKIKAFMISLIGMAKWTSNFNEKSAIVRLIIDSTFALPMIKNRSDLEGLHRLSADMCHKLHAQRTWLLQKKLNCRVSVGTATLDHT